MFHVEVIACEPLSHTHTGCFWSPCLKLLLQHVLMGLSLASTSLTVELGAVLTADLHGTGSTWDIPGTCEHPLW